MMIIIMLLIIAILVFLYQKNTNKPRLNIPAENNIKQHWIFTHIDEKAEENFKKLIRFKNWQFGQGKGINRMKKGDLLIFYISVSGKNCRYFAGNATITSLPHMPTRTPLGNGKGILEVNFDNISIWANKVYLTEKLKNNLFFICRAANPGLAFKDKPAILIDKHDYNYLLKQSLRS